MLTPNEIIETRKKLKEIIENSEGTYEKICKEPKPNHSKYYRQKRARLLSQVDDTIQYFSKVFKKNR